MSVALADREHVAPSRSLNGTLLGRLGIGGGAVVAFVGLVTLLYLIGAHIVTGDSDKATVILEGHAMAHGNVFLHGWILPLDSFWTEDALLYALLTLVSGLHTGLLHLGPAIVAAGAIAAGVGFVRSGARGAAAVAGSVTVVALVAFPTIANAFFLAGDGYHDSTVLWALLAFWLLREGRFGWSWALGSLSLALAALGDLEIFDYAIVPIALAGVVASARRRDWRAGIPHVSAVAAAVVIGEAVRQVMNHFGGFAVSRGLALAKPHQALANVWHIFTYGADLLVGNRTAFGTGDIPQGLAYVHMAGAIVFAACAIAALALLVQGVVRGSRSRADGGTGDERWRLDDMLLIGLTGPMASFVTQATAGGIGGVRYLAPSVIFGAILAGRMVARAWPRISSKQARTALAGAGLAVVACFAIGIGLYIAQPLRQLRAVPVASWLEQHHLTNGVGDYWAASIVTVASRGDVAVRPVNGLVDKRLERIMNQSAAQWFSGQGFQFLLYNVPVWSGVNTEAAVNTWGQPDRAYQVDGYYVLVYNHPVHVAPIAPTH